MRKTDSLWLVVNPASGGNDEAAVGKLVEALAPARIVAIDADPDLSPAALSDNAVATLAIFAGDGTLSAVLRGLEGWPGRVLVLPGGTTNLLARELHGEDASVEAVTGAFLAGRLGAVRRPAIGWSGGKAVCEVLAGPGARWSDVREELREGGLLSTAQSAVEAARETATGSQVRLIEPALGKPEGYGGVRLVPAPSGMKVDGYGADGIADYLKQGLALVRRNFREGPHDELGVHPAVGCATTDGAAMDLMIDGERAFGLPQETFSLVPLAVDLLASRR